MIPYLRKYAARELIPDIKRCIEVRRAKIKQIEARISAYAIEHGLEHLLPQGTAPSVSGRIAVVAKPATSAT